MGTHLFGKVWEMHKVVSLSETRDQLFIGLHLVHEVTSPQAFQALRERGLRVKYPERTIATVDHIVPTQNQRVRPLVDTLAEQMMSAIEVNTNEFGIRFYGVESDSQGIVHIIGPEKGLTQPGMTIACGDSHTSTHGAFGSIALGIGTSQVRDVLATQTLAIDRLKVRKVEVVGKREPGVEAKDIILKIISTLGVTGGIGYAYEYCGDTISELSMEQRMTVCNMSIEGGARVGYINPDSTTFEYIRGREFAPQGDLFERAVKRWESMASDEDATYDDCVSFDVSDLSPMVTWGITPGQAIPVDGKMPTLSSLPEDQREIAKAAYDHMGFSEGQKIEGEKIDVAFIGSCTNGRLSDLMSAAQVVKGNRVADHVTALVVPGSQEVRRQAEKEGLHEIFTNAGFEWREPGCSMCLAMNPDKLSGTELCASSSNRNFVGRQGAPKGRTLLMNPAMVAISALHGCVTDVRKHI